MPQGSALSRMTRGRKGARFEEIEPGGPVGVEQARAGPDRGREVGGRHGDGVVLGGFAEGPGVLGGFAEGRLRLGLARGSGAFRRPQGGRARPRPRHRRRRGPDGRRGRLRTEPHASFSVTRSRREGRRSRSTSASFGPSVTPCSSSAWRQEARVAPLYGAGRSAPTVHPTATRPSLKSGWPSFRRGRADQRQRTAATGTARDSACRSCGRRSHAAWEDKLQWPGTGDPRRHEGRRTFRWLDGGPLAAEMEAIDREALVQHQSTYILPTSRRAAGQGREPVSSSKATRSRS